MYKRTAPLVNFTDLSHHPDRIKYAGEPGPSSRGDAKAFAPIVPQRCGPPQPARVPFNISPSVPKGIPLYYMGDVVCRSAATQSWSLPTCVLVDQHTKNDKLTLQIFWSEPNVFYAVSMAGATAVTALCQTSPPRNAGLPLTVPAIMSPAERQQRKTNLFLYSQSMLVDYMGTFKVAFEHAPMSDSHFRRFCDFAAFKPPNMFLPALASAVSAKSHKLCPALVRIKLEYVGHDHYFMEGLSARCYLT